MKRDLFSSPGKTYNTNWFYINFHGIVGLLLMYLIVTSRLMNLRLKINEIILILNNFTCNFE